MIGIPFTLLGPPIPIPLRENDMMSMCVRTMACQQANVVVVTSIVSIKSEKEFSQGEKVMLEASA